MRVLKTGPSNPVLDVAFSPDCRAVAVADTGPIIYLWNLDSPTIAPVRLSGDGAYLPGTLRFSPNTRQLSWQIHDGFRRYNRDTRTTQHEPFTHARNVIWWRISDDGARAISAYRMPDHCLTGWRLAEEEWIRQWQLSTLNLFVGSETLAPAGDRFAMFARVTENDPWQLEVRDIATSALLATGSYPYSYAGKLCFHPRGEQIAGIHEMTLLVWPLPTGGEPRLVRNDSSRKHFTALAYHPNGQHLFATSNDETVHVFDTHTLERANRFTWQLDRLSTITVSADGTLAAAGSANGDVVVWDLE